MCDNFQKEVAWAVESWFHWGPQTGLEWGGKSGALLPDCWGLEVPLAVAGAALLLFWVSACQ